MDKIKEYLKKYKVILIINFILLIYLIVGLVISSIISITEYEDELLEDISIIQISDLHLKANNQNILKNIVNKINDKEPDVVVFTGDLFEDDQSKFNNEDYSYISMYLSAINTNHKLAILGNHDIYRGDVSSTLLNSGFTILDDSHYNVDKYTFYGTKSSYDIEYTVNNINSLSNVILLTHEPDNYLDYKDNKNILFQLSGHSHGGQVRLPLIGGLIYPDGSKEYGNRNIYDLNYKLYVNFGMGNSVLDIRHYNSKTMFYIK